MFSIRLVLDCNKITEIKGLDNLVNLEYVDLHGNPITSIEGLLELKKLPKLRIVNLRRIGVNPSVINKFKKDNNISFIIYD